MLKFTRKVTFIRFVFVCLPTNEEVSLEINVFWVFKVEQFARSISDLIDWLLFFWGGWEGVNDFSAFLKVHCTIDYFFRFFKIYR